MISLSADVKAFSALSVWLVNVSYWSNSPDSSSLLWRLEPKLGEFRGLLVLFYSYKLFSTIIYYNIKYRCILRVSYHKSNRIAHLTFTVNVLQWIERIAQRIHRNVCNVYWSVWSSPQYSVYTCKYFINISYVFCNSSCTGLANLPVIHFHFPVIFVLWKCDVEIKANVNVLIHSVYILAVLGKLL